MGSKLRTKVIVFEEAGLLSLAAFLFNTKCLQAYYFKATPFFEAAYSRLRRIGVVKTDIKRLQFDVLDLKEKDGENSFIRMINKDFVDICEEARKGTLASNRAIKALCETIGKKDKISLYFLKTFSPDIRKLLILVNAIGWYIDTGKIPVSAETVFSVSYNPFIGIFKRYADKRGIKIEAASVGFKKTLKRCVSLLISNPASQLKNFLVYSIRKRGTGSFMNDETERRLSVFYSCREVTFDSTKRCDFFWLLKSALLQRRAILYSVYPKSPIKEEAMRDLQGHDIKFIPIFEGIVDSKIAPVWTPTPTYFRMLFKLNLKVYIAIARDLLSGKPGFIELGGEILNFNRWYSLWYDFFTSLNIKVNVNPPDYDPTTIIINSAIENAGGISLSYQIADFEAADLDYCSCSNVFFSFGPYYKEKLLESGAFTDNIVFCGYLTDYVFSELKEVSCSLRTALLNKGAEFIISYFDENSSDSEFAVIKNKAASEIYRALFERVINDKTLGLICKPKKPKTLRKRIAGLSVLMDEAIRTGRCVFLDDGDDMSRAYPAEAAKASDIAVGLFRGGTTALESFLSGTPTVYLDLEKMYSTKTYNPAKRDLIFDDLKSLFIMIEEFRRSPKVRECLTGLFEGTIKGKDPFRDTRASERMSSYITCLLEGIDKGMNSSGAIERANTLYKKEWGVDKAVNMNAETIGVNQDEARELCLKS